jgi:hypothetical protein
MENSQNSEDKAGIDLLFEAKKNYTQASTLISSNLTETKEENNQLLKSILLSTFNTLSDDEKFIIIKNYLDSNRQELEAKAKEFEINEATKDNDLKRYAIKFLLWLISITFGGLVLAFIILTSIKGTLDSKAIYSVITPLLNLLKLLFGTL